MDFNQILELLDHFDQSDAVYLKWCHNDGDEFVLKKAGAYPAKTVSAVSQPVVQTAAPVSEKPSAAPADAAAENTEKARNDELSQGDTINAPLVGTFYQAPSPDDPPYVKAGDTVHKGETVGLIEAMKMMSEIPAPFDCEILEVLKDNGTMAEFDEPLMRVRKL
ncbi:acetyl-CoA carboxylase biotin carboxyl carrier protein [Pseudoramibacter sp.]|jgi:acetyl-CoA carboxylase biotin carboxyl carrier protein|uniref:acetyl-CoA carboxylase biotin carboxyl carrier protein n=1 Tax=Pseudoramibacter sp. TaxID=2034862 RepID=UPI0025D8FE2D|nr:acetyl-CoA carboxylase biotin carboxyl carrier protein [Pseudoramibacter sp.]MCH4072277.1 acetyl-CoA carboxylase biotin carboxyl carrier protein [Pseudoramibacter sp.]MCH4106047.1 acetyl-CoA carboxylase biotin carboxyl carrier protein [Pseudoramibacter sp.]